jgi:hypothetical protein
VTKAGIEEIKKALPGLTVHQGDPFPYPPPIPPLPAPQVDAIIPRWLVYALLAAAGLGSIWGAKQVLTKRSSMVADPPKPRVGRLDLGADGKGGVWLREVPPWEK